LWVISHRAKVSRPGVKKQNVPETSMHWISLHTAKIEEQQIGIMQLTQNEINK